MNDIFLRATKVLLYLAPVSVLIVASSMFFPFIVGKAILLRIMVELGLFAYVCYLLSPGSAEKWEHFKTVSRHPLFIALATFTLLFLLSSLTAVDSMIAFWSNFERGEGALQMLHYGIYFCLVALVLRSKREWYAYSGWILFLGLFVSLYAWGQRFGGSAMGFFGDGTRASGTLGNPLYLSTFILFLFFFALWLIKEKQDLLLRIVLVMYSIFQLATFAALAQSRNGVAGLGLGIVVGFFTLAFLKTNTLTIGSYSLRRIAAGILVLSILLGGIFYVTRTNPFWQNFPGLKRFARERVLTGIDDRVWTWETTLQGIKEKPFLGWGPENFPIIFDKYYNANHFGSDSWFDRAHDIYLEYLIDGGIVLFLGYIAIWAMFIRELRRRRHLFPPVTLALFTGFATAYFVQGLTAFEVLPIYILLYAFFAFLIRLSLDLDAPIDDRDQRKHPTHGASSREVPLWHYLVIIGVGSAVVLAMYFANYLPYRKNRLLLTAAASQGNQGEAFLVFMGGKDPQTGKEYPGALTYYSPIGQQETVQYFNLFVLKILEANANNPEFAKQADSIKQLVQRTNEIYEENENTPFRAVGAKTLYYLGLIHFRAAMITRDQTLIDKAETLMRKGYALAPDRLEFIYGLLDIAAAKSDRVAAGPLIERAKTLRPDLQQNAAYEALFAKDSVTSTPKKP